MFKIDWATAIGGALVGYIAKGKVEDAKTRFKRICTTTVEGLKESFEDPFQKAWNQNTQAGQNQGGQNNGH